MSINFKSHYNMTIKITVHYIKTGLPYRTVLYCTVQYSTVRYGTVCVFSFFSIILSETFLILQRTEEDMTIQVQYSTVQYSTERTVLYCTFSNWRFLFSENRTVYGTVWYSQTGHRWQYKTARALCMLDD